jgi:FkbM family methyltransferase
MLEKALFTRHPLASLFRKAAQRLLGGPREAVFQFHRGPAKNLSFSCLTSHKYFFVRERYEQELQSPLERMIRPGMTAFDIGAHFGYWALALSRMCGQTGQVFAFEPVPGNRERLVRNLEINSISNVRVIPLVVSDTSGSIRMSNQGSMSALEHGELSVEATTIDLFCQQNPAPDFVLVDVEGFAGSVFRGAANTYARKFAPLICEIHNREEEREFERFAQGRTIQKLSNGTRFAYRSLAF